MVAETSNTLTFFPLRPAALGHTLVIPKRHVRDLWHSQPNLAVELTRAAVAVGRAIDKALHPDGMNLITSAGAAASQTVMHLHLHLVPRWEGDHIGNIWPPPEPWPDAVTKDDIAAAIRREVHVT